MVDWQISLIFIKKMQKFFSNKENSYSINQVNPHQSCSFLLFLRLLILHWILNLNMQLRASGLFCTSSTSEHSTPLYSTQQICQILKIITKISFCTCLQHIIFLLDRFSISTCKHYHVDLKFNSL